MSRRTPICLLAAIAILSFTRPTICAAADEAPPKEAAAEAKAAALRDKVTQGALRIVGKDATVVECPLQHTAVQADVAGFIARVKVEQTFVNPTKEKIEAVYVFPLPHEAAVDAMNMKIGAREIVGVIKRRDEARAIYQAALNRGQTAALLEQERPNIFTQSVGNIEPGQEVRIEISYVDVLKYDQGTYEFHFPMVVGPRYNPAGTGRPADAEKINAPVLKPGERTGHDVSLTVNLDAGVPIQNLKNANHKVHSVSFGKTKARVRLLQEDSVPNKDFVLRYDVVGKKPEMAMLAHTGKYSGDAAKLGEGYFMLMIQPKEDERLKKSPPREVVFLVDVSGSMRGDLTAKTRESMQNMLKLCRAGDTFQVITFAGRSEQLFDKPVPVNDENIKTAVGYTRGFQGGGGTEMLTGIKMAIDQPIDKKRLRIVVMLTDGYIGNETQIIEHVGKHCGDQIRFWAIGIGSSPNMFLIDGVAKQGGGMGKKLGLKDDTVALTTEVMTRIQRAQLANIKIDWGDLPVSETYPAKLPELWAGRPVVVFGRYKNGGESKVKISGTVEGEDVTWPLAVTLPEKQADHDTLAKTWARRKIESLMQQTYYIGSPAVEEEVTAIALDYGLMSQYTSFVAVDPKNASPSEAPARPPRRMSVPVPLPEGTQWEGFFGGGGGFAGDGVVLLGKDVEKRIGEQQALLKAVESVNVAAKIPSTEIEHRIRSLELAFRMQTHVPGRLAAVDRLNRQSNTGGSSRNPYGGQSYGRQGQGQAQGRGLGLAQQQRGGWAFQPNNSRYGVFERAVGGVAIELADAETEAVGKDPVAWGATAYVLAEESSKLAKAATDEMNAAKELLKQGKLQAARSALLRAIFIDSAAMNWSSGGAIATEAIGELQTLHQQQVAAWTTKLPGLNKKLDLVLRDTTIDAALQQVAKAADIEIELLPCSVADSQSLRNSDARITYLDLRRATVAQAMDWILQPSKIDWSLSGEKLIAATSRRTAGQSCWVYDVATIALPAKNELAALKDNKKALEAAKKSADDFIAAVRGELKIGEKAKADWFSPGHILIIADKATHAAAGELFANLADKEFEPNETLAKLHAVTSKRATERAEPVATLRSLQRRFDAAGVLDHFSLELLAAAAAGNSNVEALTELQIAWKSAEVAKLLEGSGSPLALRSLWMICEAARALPDNGELAALAKLSLEKAIRSAAAALDALQKKPDDLSALAGVAFAALAMADDAQYVREAKQALDKAPSLSGFREATLALLAESDEINHAALAKLIRGGLAGEDLILLAALACRRAGGELWQHFRVQSQDLLSKHPLRGEVVVLINRLPESRLIIAGQE